MTTSGPNVTVRTPADELAAIVNACWPRCKFTAQQAGYKLARFGKYGLRPLMDAVRQAYALDDAGVKPDWSVIEEIVRSCAAKKGAQFVRRNDAADSYRRWWGSWFAEREPGRELTRSDRTLAAAVASGKMNWAREILETDSEAHNVTLEDFEQWHSACDRFALWSFWLERKPAQPEDCERDKHGGSCRCSLYVRCMAARRRDTSVIHALVLGLKEFGRETRAQRRLWLTRLETAAMEFGLRLSNPETLAVDDTLPWM